jgi:hypothetical protein
VIADRVKELSTTTGTGTFTLTGAVTGFEGFNTAFGIGPSFEYCIESIDAATGAPNGYWEIGSGHLSGATTLVRDTVRQSSNADALVAFTAGTKNVFCTLPASVIIALQNSIDAKVAKAGDTMTGSLEIDAADALLLLNSAAGGHAPTILARKGGVADATKTRWTMFLGDGAAESGSNVGSNFAIYRNADNGALIDAPLAITRNEGRLVGNGVVPTSGNELTNKAYADTKLALTGGTLTGDLTAALIRSSIGLVYSESTGAGQNAYFAARDVSGNNKALFFWDATSNTARMLGPGGDPVSISTAGVVAVGAGYNGRAGNGGAYDDQPHNTHWTGAVCNLWVGYSNLGAISVTCDYRIKKDVAPLPSVWEQVKALKPVSYTQAEFTPPIEKIEFLKNAERAAKENLPPPAPLETMFVADDVKRWGFLAHELQETLLPTAASGTKDSPTEVQAPSLMAIIAALTRALQEAMARIEALEGVASAG